MIKMGLGLEPEALEPQSLIEKIIIKMGLRLEPEALEPQSLIIIKRLLLKWL
jgi:hypothetical protein